jgi:hypothetical protein
MAPSDWIPEWFDPVGQRASVHLFYCTRSREGFMRITPGDLTDPRVTDLYKLVLDSTDIVRQVASWFSQLICFSITSRAPGHTPRRAAITPWTLKACNRRTSLFGPEERARLSSQWVR